MKEYLVELFLGDVETTKVIRAENKEDLKLELEINYDDDLRFCILEERDI